MIILRLTAAYGRRGNATDCPVAHAMRRLLREQYVVTVTNKITVIDRDTLKTVRSYELPKKLKAYIDAFDAGKPLPDQEIKVHGVLPPLSDTGVLKLYVN